VPDYELVSIADFAGLNEDSNPNELGPNELRVARNCWRQGKRFGTRAGVEREGTASGNYDAAISSGAAIHGIYDYRNRLASTGKLIVVCGGVVHTDDATTLTKGAGVTISSGQNNKWTFCTHKNNLYMAGGANADTVTKWTGTGDLAKVTFQNSGSTDIDAKYVFTKWNYGFLAGMNGTAVEDNPMVVRYSALNDMDTWPVANTIGGSSAIGGLPSYGQTSITGFAEFTDNTGDWLLILTDKALFPVLQTPDPLAPFYIDSAIANGCVHQNAFVSLGLDAGDAIYLSERGIHSLRQSQRHGSKEHTFLSWKIRETFETINRSRLKYAEGAYYPKHGVVLFAISTGSNTTNDTILCLDVKNTRELTAENARWYIWDVQGVKANVLATAKDASTDASYIYAGSYDGNVFRFNDTTYTDLGTGFEVRWRTKDDDRGQPHIEKGLGDIYVDAGPGGAYQPTVQPIFDYGTRSGEALAFDLPEAGAVFGTARFGTDVWGSADEIWRNRLYGKGYGYTVGWEFSHIGTNEPFFVTNHAYQVRPLGKVQVR
jgi:hypothetical protein